MSMTRRCYNCPYYLRHSKVPVWCNEYLKKYLNDQLQKYGYQYFVIHIFPVAVGVLSAIDMKLSFDGDNSLKVE